MYRKSKGTAKCSGNFKLEARYTAEEKESMAFLCEKELLH